MKEKLTFPWQQGIHRHKWLLYLKAGLYFSYIHIRLLDVQTKGQEDENITQENSSLLIASPIEWAKGGNSELIVIQSRVPYRKYKQRTISDAVCKWAALWAPIGVGIFLSLRP